MPKEEIDTFKKNLYHFTMSNKRAQYSEPVTEKENDYIDNMSRYVDGSSFTNLHSIELCNNNYLVLYANRINISIRNLSASFSVIRYRFFVSNEFKKQYESVIKNQYEPYTEIFKQIYTPWYRPDHFGRSFFSSDNRRTKEVYLLLSQLKWEAFCELRKFFTIHFACDNMFPPVFETYSTNIQLDNHLEGSSFLNSIGYEFYSDYSNDYNICVNWSNDNNNYQALRLLGFCGGNKTEADHLPEIAEYEISNYYGVYMVANSLKLLAERDIAECNKKISKVIRGSKTYKLLKVKSMVRRKLYYSYRFINEFSGDSLGTNDIRSFKSRMVDDYSFSKKAFELLPDSISKVKKEIDSLIDLLDNAAEYEAVLSNLKLQWVLAVITLLSLLLAIIGITGIGFDGIWQFLLNVLHFK